VADALGAVLAYGSMAMHDDLPIPDSPVVVAREPGAHVALSCLAP
jgi:hypothetical protein